MQNTHTHTLYKLIGMKRWCCLTEIFWEEKYLEFAFEGRESSTVPDVLEEIVPDVGTKVRENAKAMGFAVSMYLAPAILFPRPFLALFTLRWPCMVDVMFKSNSELGCKNPVVNPPSPPTSTTHPHPHHHHKQWHWEWVASVMVSGWGGHPHSRGYGRRWQPARRDPDSSCHTGADLTTTASSTHTDPFRRPSHWGRWTTTCGARFVCVCVYVFGFVVVVSSGRGELWGKVGALLARIYCEVLYFVGKEGSCGGIMEFYWPRFIVLYFVGEEGRRREFYWPWFIVCCTL